MHNVMLGITGSAGMFAGLDLVLRIPSMWGYLALACGWFLLAVGVIREARQ